MRVDVVGLWRSGRDARILRGLMFEVPRFVRRVTVTVTGTIPLTGSRQSKGSP